MLLSSQLEDAKILKVNSVGGSLRRLFSIVSQTLPDDFKFSGLTRRHGVSVS